jgi:hypothetical protein
MKYNVNAYIIYYVEPIAICQENLLLLLSDVGVHLEEESAPIPAELLVTIMGGVARGAIAVVVMVEEVAQSYLQGL